MAWRVYWHGEEGTKQYFGGLDAPSFDRDEKPKTYQTKKDARAALKNRAAEADCDEAEYAIEHVDEWIVKWPSIGRGDPFIYFVGGGNGVESSDAWSEHQVGVESSDAWSEHQVDAKRFPTKEAAKDSLRERWGSDDDFEGSNVRFLKLVAKKPKAG